MEPWYDLARLVAIPPTKLWFNWRFEDLDRIPRTGPAIVAANHISYLDPFANGYAILKAGRRPRFLAKDELFKVPVVGTVLRGAHQIPVDRGSGGAAPLISASRALDEGRARPDLPRGHGDEEPGLPPDAGEDRHRAPVAHVRRPHHAAGELGESGGVAEVREEAR